MRIKICGVTRVEEVQLAAELGAWAIGFNFCPLSPRYLTVDEARPLVAAVPEGLLRVGVFVDASIEQIEATLAATGITHVQLHGDEPAEVVAHFGDRAIKGLRLRAAQQLDALSAFASAAGLLVDAYVPGLAGGTGKVADWSLACHVKRFGPVILAGGLHAGNIADALRSVAPYAVDVCSGIEAAPGVKDPAKMRAFFTAVHRYEGGHR